MASNLSFLAKNAVRTPNLEELLPLPGPLGLCIEPTNHCNMRCRFCPVHLEEFPAVVGGRRFMDFALFEKIIHDIRALGQPLTNLNLYGDGEPFLNKELLDMIRLATRMQVAQNIIVTSNGSAITEKIAVDLIESGLTHLRVSIYGVDEDFHRHITGSTIKPAKVHTNIDRLRKLRDAVGSRLPHIYVKMIGTSETRSQIERFRDMYSGVADEVNVENPINWNGFNNNDLVGALDPRHESDLTLVQGWHKQKGQSNSHKLICTTPFLSLNVKSDGVVTICIVDWNKGTAVGDITRESLSDIWHGERLRAFRRMHIEKRRHENPSCRNCMVLHNSPDNIDEMASADPERLLYFPRPRES
ncbi:MAG: radical SAM/SPASM domain-containing protein [Sulfuritalea sp.]|nr:radical SAM/SPASM domain-containing protein [Sulfuritalea sp.]